MLHADGRGGLGGHIHLGVALALEAGGEGQKIRVMPLGQRSDSRRVDAAGQERADGDISTHVLFHAVFQSLGNVVEKLLLQIRRNRGDVELRIKMALFAERGVRDTQGNRATGLHTPDVRVQAFGLRDVLEVDVVLQCATVEAEVEVQLGCHLEDRLLLGGEYSADLGLGVVQGLDAELVPGSEHSLRFAIPDHDGEHAAQVTDDVLTPVVVAHDDGLAVTLSVKRVPRGGELLPELNVVVDLAVKRHGVPVGIILRAPLQRLVGVRKIDNGQAVKPEHHVIVVPRPHGIGAAVVHAGERALHRRHQLARVTGWNE